MERLRNDSIDVDMLQDQTPRNLRDLFVRVHPYNEGIVILRDIWIWDKMRLQEVTRFLGIVHCKGNQVSGLILQRLERALEEQFAMIDDADVRGNLLDFT